MQKKDVFVNCLRPDLFQMARASGHKIKMHQSRGSLVVFDGQIRPASQVRTTLLTFYNFYTHNGAPCQV